MFWHEPETKAKQRWRDWEIDVDLSFDTVLRFIELFQMNELEKADRLYHGFELFVDEETIQFFDEYLMSIDRIDFMIVFAKEKLGIDFMKEASDQTSELIEGDDTGSDDEPKPPSFDFIEDASRIYSSFLKDYQIDLYEKRGSLSWADFLSLLGDLSDETEFKRAMHYRNKPIPAPINEKHYSNKDEINHIRAMKERYAFKSERMRQLVLKAQEEASLRQLKNASAIFRGAYERKKKGVKSDGG
ncbi:hypothetical protein EXIGUO8H_20331 [Exiguobacterium sp. 8H]|uniref:Gp15 family bacteriophage protein n=1 Tax=unclassified Exiguobacterium TaxID=2644629 RepID=UPI0012F1E056|nr:MULTISPECIES: Gp15 family bacteriophage protein [unclassified Exiguobacterium]VXB51462.1 hypothetical protein EXIGUO8A_11399 [Exiguobacterium sp. 8A]VXB52227.1 hypothetical protein EXIGUO8H_20331 [Exiguobacterium sp. 8H]